MLIMAALHSSGLCLHVHHHVLAFSRLFPLTAICKSHARASRIQISPDPNYELRCVFFFIAPMPQPVKCIGRIRAQNVLSRPQGHSITVDIILPNESLTFSRAFPCLVGHSSLESGIRPGQAGKQVLSTLCQHLSQAQQKREWRKSRERIVNATNLRSCRDDFVQFFFGFFILFSACGFFFCCRSRISREK